MNDECIEKTTVHDKEALLMTETKWREMNSATVRTVGARSEVYRQ